MHACRSTLEDPTQRFEHRIRYVGGDDDLGSIWSRHRLHKPGRGLLAYCWGTEPDATRLLVDENCMLYPAEEPYVGDVRAILRLERTRASPYAVLALARAEKKVRGGDFAHYVAYRFQDRLVSDDTVLDAILALVEDPELDAQARFQYLYGINERLPAPGDDDDPRAGKVRFARCLFRVLAMPEAAKHHTHIVESLLFNLASPNRPQPYVWAGDVFAGRPAERAAAIELVKKQPASERQQQVLAWLRNS